MQESDNKKMGSRPPRSHRAKKRFGQHFLHDRNIIEKIVRTARVSEGDRILEIGPGTGSLTGALLEAGASVTAIELDRDLICSLEERFVPTGRFEVISADALGLSFVELAESRGFRFKVVSNLPYNISGPLTVRFVEEREAFTVLVLMYQKEVASRLIAKPGTREYGALTVLTRVYMDVRKEFDVSRGSFTPPPKVDSTVVSMKVRQEPAVMIKDEEFFRKVVKGAFGQRRKTLLNALKSLGLPPQHIKDALLRCGIYPGRRGETLTLKEFSDLTAALSC